MNDVSAGEITIDNSGGNIAFGHLVFNVIDMPIIGIVVVTGEFIGTDDVLGVIVVPYLGIVVRGVDIDFTSPVDINIFGRRTGPIFDGTLISSSRMYYPV